MNRILKGSGLVILALFASACSEGIDETLRLRQAPWDSSVINDLAALPVQDAGRVKPLGTLAQFCLLPLNGNREFTLKWSDGQRETLSATEFLADCLLYPEQARHYRCVRVDNNEALQAVGLQFEGRKRLDRYSYEDLRPAHTKLFELARAYNHIDKKQRTPVQGQIVDLANNVVLLDRLLASGDWARTKVDLHRTEGLRAAFAESANVSVSELLGSLPTLVEMTRVVAEGGDSLAEDRKDSEMAALRGIFNELEHASHGAGMLVAFPPTDSRQDAWLSLNDLIDRAVAGLRPEAEHVAMLQQFEGMVESRDDPAQLREAAAALLGSGRGLATRRGEYDTVGLEVSYYQWDLLYKALVAFGLAVVLVALVWLMPSRIWVYRVANGTTLVALGMLVAGITMRCVIRGRPPVSTLYETILFITAVTAMIAMLMEWIHRRRIGLSMGAGLGLVGMFMARRFEELEATDTMPQLQAVLDTNFWLSTHVTSITMGYAAGLLASFLGTIYLLGKLFGMGRRQPESLRAVARMVYGTICFGLLMSVVGTILGGVWANDSWGRFWGWDPKENGALLICLAMIATLHGRMGGYLRDHGICMAAVATGIIVAFSWWHVNFLGVGLHTYGFIDGVLSTLTGFYLLQTLILLLGGWAWLRERVATRQLAVAGEKG